MDKVQVVIMCAGKGTRLAPLTDTIPKVLVEISKGKSVLEYNLDNLVGVASEIILIIGYLGDKIREKIGPEYNGILVKYVVQEEQLGTGHAINCCKDILDERFMVLNGDDLYKKRDLEMMNDFEFCVLGFEVEDPRSFGVLNVNSDDFLIELIEKPGTPPSNLVNIGAYILSKKIFDFELSTSSRGELEITDYLNYLAKGGDNVLVLPTDFWLPVGNMEQLENAREILN